MADKILFKSYDCDCTYTDYFEVTLEELKEEATSGELDVRCPDHGHDMYPIAYVDD